MATSSFKRTYVYISSGGAFIACNDGNVIEYLLGRGFYSRYFLVDFWECPGLNMLNASFKLFFLTKKNFSAKCGCCVFSIT